MPFNPIKYVQNPRADGATCSCDAEDIYTLLLGQLTLHGNAHCQVDDCGCHAFDKASGQDSGKHPKTNDEKKAKWVSKYKSGFIYFLILPSVMK